MEIISDLTRDTRPSLIDMFEESLREVAKVDLQKSNDNEELVAYENYTFYYRVIISFTQNAVKYYTNKEIQLWCKENLLDEAVLPEVPNLFDFKEPF